MAARPINVLGLCSGICGLELGIHRALPAARTVCLVEREAFAAAVVVARMADQALDPAPVWDDLATFDGGAWRGVVDLVAAGFPCQPASVAGKRRGQDDERWIWPLVARIIGDVGPSLVVLENVRGLLSVGGGSGFHEVLSDLSRLGFSAEWGVVRASDVGAPHRRERVFVLAYTDAGRELLRCSQLADTGHRPAGPDQSRGGDEGRTADEADDCEVRGELAHPVVAGTGTVGGSRAAEHGTPDLRPGDGAAGTGGADATGDSVANPDLRRRSGPSVHLRGGDHNKPFDCLTGQAMKWPTPQAADGKRESDTMFRGGKGTRH